MFFLARLLWRVRQYCVNRSGRVGFLISFLIWEEKLCFHLCVCVCARVCVCVISELESIGLTSGQKVEVVNISEVIFLGQWAKWMKYFHFVGILMNYFQNIALFLPLVNILPLFVYFHSTTFILTPAFFKTTSLNWRRHKINYLKLLNSSRNFFWISRSLYCPRNKNANKPIQD